MINRYCFKYRNRILVILARSIPEAMEPWARINHRSYTQEEFRSALIPSPKDTDFLLLVGNTITREELKKFQKEKVVVVDKNPEPIVEIKKEKVPTPILNIEDYIEMENDNV